MYNLRYEICEVKLATMSRLCLQLHCSSMAPAAATTKTATMTTTTTATTTIATATTTTTTIRPPPLFLLLLLLLLLGPGIYPNLPGFPLPRPGLGMLLVEVLLRLGSSGLGLGSLRLKAAGSEARNLHSAIQVVSFRGLKSIAGSWFPVSPGLTDCNLRSKMCKTHDADKGSCAEARHAMPLF